MKKSVVIAGRHETSISIEKEFYDELMKIAGAKNLSFNQIVTIIDSERGENNLSSAIRLYVLESLKCRI